MINEVAEGVIDSAKSLRAPIWHLARGTLRGALEAVLAADGPDLESAARVASAALVRQADEIGGDIRAAAKGAVEGAVLAADRLALGAPQLASAAAAGALSAARALREDAWEQILPVVRGPIQGVPVRIACAPEG